VRLQTHTRTHHLFTQKVACVCVWKIRRHTIRRIMQTHIAVAATHYCYYFIPSHCFGCESKWPVLPLRRHYAAAETNWCHCHLHAVFVIPTLYIVVWWPFCFYQLYCEASKVTLIKVFLQTFKFFSWWSIAINIYFYGKNYIQITKII
jgi:hypothetical protein